MTTGKKTVLLFCNTFAAMLQFRGALIKDLVAQGHNVVVAAQTDGTSELEIAQMGATIAQVPLNRSGFNPFQELMLIISIVRIFRKMRPDIIFSYTIKPNVYSLPIARLWRIPSVAVVTGLGYAFLNKGVLPWLARTLLRTSLARATHIWFLNRADQKMICGARAALQGRSSILPGEGINTGWYVQSPLPAPPTRFLMIARLLVDKGIREYVAAAKKVCQTHKDVQFDILGPFDPGNPASIGQAELDEAIAHPQINYLGVTDDVRPFLAACHCVVLPSYREGIPLVLLEAAAVARAQIATDVPGCNDVVIDGRNGFLCQMADVDSLATSLEKFINLPTKERAEMGAAARDDVVRRFDERIIFRCYQDKIAKLSVTQA